MKHRQPGPQWCLLQRGSTVLGSLNKNSCREVCSLPPSNCPSLPALPFQPLTSWKMELAASGVKGQLGRKGWDLCPRETAGKLVVIRLRAVRSGRTLRISTSREWGVLKRKATQTLTYTHHNGSG